MIVFLCKCGQTISVKDEEAGLSMQCPACKCLVDVPTINDLESMEPDGTVRMEPVPETPDHFHDKMRAFGKQADMRMNVDEFLAIGDEIPLADEVKKVAARPRYDGTTGELITDIPLRDDPVQIAPHEIPMAQAALNYANFNTQSQTAFTTANTPVRVLAGTNLLVLFFVWVAHGSFYLTLLPPMMAALVLPLAGISALLILAHYAALMEDIAVGDSNELPTLFRRASLTEDLIQPAQAMLGALVCAALPAIVVMAFCPHFKQRPHVIVALWIVALLLWPAFALTASTSGAINNMLPHRALSVITAAPVRYLLCLLPYLAAMAAYAGLGIWVIYWLGDWLRLSSTPYGVQILLRFGGVTIFTLMATYFMHVACVWMALTYRTHYEKFNWVLQRHIKSDRIDTMSQLRSLRHQRDPRVTPGLRRKP